MHDPLDQLRHQVATQHGAATIEQLEAAGFGDWDRRRARAEGLLEKVGAHTYRSGLAPTSARDDLAALLIDCGAESAWASGPTAAALHGFDGFVLRPPFHVTVERGRNVQRVGHHIHTTVELPLIDRSIVDGMRVMSPVRSVIDLSRHSSVAELTVAIDCMLRDGGGSERLLHERAVALASRGRPGVRKVLAAIEGAEVQRGAHSWLERRYLDLVAAAGLPRPEVQAVLSRSGDRLVRVDCHFAGTPVVVELLGYRWHRTQAQMSSDARRMNTLVLDGWVPVQFTYRQVVGTPSDVVSTTADALACHGGLLPRSA